MSGYWLVAVYGGGVVVCAALFEITDHVWPVARGGDDSDANLQTLCHPCNAGKGASLPTSHDLRSACA